MKNLSKEAEKIMTERFGKDTVIEACWEGNKKG